MRTLFFICFMTLFTMITYSQTMGEIEGYVFGPDKKALIGATVSTSEKGQLKYVQTDEKGKFVLKPLNVGTFSVSITFMGYDTVINNSINVTADGTARIKDVYMEEYTITCGTIIINGGIDNIDRPVITKIPFKDFKNIPSEKGSISSVLTAKSTEVKIDEKTNKLIVRGARPTSTSYIVDGMRMSDDPMLPSMAIGNIELFSSGIPAKYGDVSGGVIVVNTKTFFDVYNERKMKEELAAYQAGCVIVQPDDNRH